MKILGIESSCDETAIAIVNGDGEVLAHAIASHIESHTSYGGVVPELASRNHLDAINMVFTQVMRDANLSLGDIDAIAVTSGPGLIGGLLVGVMFAKGIATMHKKPIIAINHLEAHALTARLTENINFPYLMLLVSGGHCQILEVKGVSQYVKLGSTRDDAVGEAFDKVAKMIGLPYPGGPIIERLARNGNEKTVELPIPILRDSIYDFSFSGLKTAIRRHIESAGEMNDQQIADLCASFQRVVTTVLVDRMRNAATHFKNAYDNSAKQVVIAGGVAANQHIKSKLTEAMSEFDLEVITPPIKLCTDNGVMVAWAGVEYFKIAKLDTLDFEPRSRWPLDNT